MSDQEIYDRKLDSPQPPAVLPNEPYYQRPPQPRRPARSKGLGIALVAGGMLLLAFQLFDGGASLGGAGNITLIDQDYQGNRIELSVASSDVEIRPGGGNRIHI